LYDEFLHQAAPVLIADVHTRLMPPHHCFARLLSSLEVLELTNFLAALFIPPDTLALSVRLSAPQIEGKNYLHARTERPQEILDFHPGERADCRHGIKKQWCGICKREAQPSRPKSKLPRLDVFDLILPILQVPPGENLDSRLWFPEGKTLYEFQRKGIRFLIEHPNALLGDEMGLGKSIQAIVSVRILFRLARITSALIVCPKSLVSDWENKLWEWAPELATLRIEGSVDLRKQAWEATIPVKIVTYETLREDIEVAREGSVDLCILDEAQKIKNKEAAISRSCKRIRNRWAWALSGTPLENKVEDLLSVFDFVRAGLLEDSDVYRREILKRKIAPFVLRRRKSDYAEILDLPEKLYDLRWLELLPRQKEAYDRAEREGIVYLSEQGDSLKVTHVLALITKLKQLCNFDPVSEESCKLDFVSDQLDELAEQSPDEKTLIFSQYPDKTLTFVEQALLRLSPLKFHGGLSQKQRDEVLSLFEKDDSKKILLLSLKAGGLGLSMSRASRVYHFDLWWNPAVASQAEDRAHRIGQKRPVFVTSFLVGGTVEERIHKILQRKKQLFGEVVDDLTDTDLETKLSEEELFGLFGLRPTRRTTAKPLRRTLEDLSPRQFEELVESLFKRMGYSTKLTRASRDGGVDIFARRMTDVTRENLIIQCKHYPRGTVGVNEARALNGLLTPDFTGAVLVTSGQFSGDCRGFCNRTRIRLVDGTELNQLLEKHHL